ncbi:hypothetical protein [Aliiglaciecola sp. M165]|uniref:hypothetical protein n=1 Tax=Aliiglaciecola sp. M165 TaxID=2593649 RepID=UPI001180DF76|nr:hypothetical protein [Aliiglaciecola sp. M165]TRY33199.1 hypothetical protein FM019_04235 [Aliiglaciecola sp. M165]
MSHFPDALSHGTFDEVFPNIFCVTGSMETVLMDKDWQFSRNMVVVREGKRLIILNSIRLDEEGLNHLDSLGSVTDVIRVGALHGRDDAFYLDRYQATYWTLPGIDPEHNCHDVQVLNTDSVLPIADASVFMFEKTQVPESIILLSREGGILIGCDAIQNWEKADRYFSAQSTEMMQEMGFFTPANVGPVWQQVACPVADDFIRLKSLTFKHALCGHGKPLLNTAKEDFVNTFSRLFNI